MKTRFNSRAVAAALFALVLCSVLGLLAYRATRARVAPAPAATSAAVTTAAPKRAPCKAAFPCILAFGVAPEKITEGESATLRFALDGAAHAKLVDLTTGAEVAVNERGGEIVVTPPSTRAYRLSASTKDNSTITQDVVVVVLRRPS
jgi:hypothetical protein